MFKGNDFWRLGGDYDAKICFQMVGKLTVLQSIHLNYDSYNVSLQIMFAILSCFIKFEHLETIFEVIYIMTQVTYYYPCLSATMGQKLWNILISLGISMAICTEKFIWNIFWSRGTIIEFYGPYSFRTLGVGLKPMKIVKSFNSGHLA